MIELVVSCALSALALVLAYAVHRADHRKRVTDDGLAVTVRSLMVAAGRYLRRQHTLTGALALVVAGVLLVAFAVGQRAGAMDSSGLRFHGVFVTVAVVAGALLTMAASRMACHLGGRTSLRVAAAAGGSIDGTLRAGLRGGVVASLLVHAMAVLAVSLGVAVLVVVSGGGTKGEALAQVLRVPSLLVALAFGSALGALFEHLGSGTFARVADIGADVVGQVEARLPEDSEQNPATVADLVGDRLGESTLVGVDGFATTLTEVVVTMLVAAIAFEANPAFPSVTAIVLFPLTVRAFTSIAGWFGVLSVRTDDTEDPLVAVYRGLLVTVALGAVATLGAATWLLGAFAMRLALAALLGLGANVLLLFVAESFTDSRHGPVRRLAETARSGPSLAVLRSLVVSADGALVHIVVLALMLFGAFALGASTGLACGGMLGIALACSGLRGAGVFMRATAAMGMAADTASGMLAIAVGDDRRDAQARVRVLSAIGATAKSHVRMVQASAGVVAALVAMTAFRLAVARSGRSEVELSHPAVIAGGGVGLLVVVAFGRAALGSVIGPARDLVHDLRDRIGRSRREGAGEACLESVSRAALRAVVLPAAIGVGVPLLVGLGLRLFSSGDSVRSSAESLVAFVSVATIAGGLGSLLLNHSGSAWDNAKRTIETGAHGDRHRDHRVSDPDTGSEQASSTEPPVPRGTTEATPYELNPTYAAALIGDTIGDPLKGAVGPALVALFETLALLVMALQPLFL